MHGHYSHSAELSIINDHIRGTNHIEKEGPPMRCSYFISNASGSASKPLSDFLAPGKEKHTDIISNHGS